MWKRHLIGLLEVMVGHGCSWINYFLMIVQSKILAWNVRGAANTELLSNVKQFVDLHRPDILIIRETRIDPIKLRRTFTLLGYNGFTYSQVRGFAGGIIIAWKEDYVSIQVCMTEFLFIHAKLCIEGEQDWFLTDVYASPNDNARRQCGMPFVVWCLR